MKLIRVSCTFFLNNCIFPSVLFFSINLSKILIQNMITWRLFDDAEIEIEKSVNAPTNPQKQIREL